MKTKLAIIVCGLCLLFLFTGFCFYTPTAKVVMGASPSPSPTTASCADITSSSSNPVSCSEYSGLDCITDYPGESSDYLSQHNVPSDALCYINPNLIADQNGNYLPGGQCNLNIGSANLCTSVALNVPEFNHYICAYSSSCAGPSTPVSCTPKTCSQNYPLQCGYNLDNGCGGYLDCNSNCPNNYNCNYANGQCVSAANPNPILSKDASLSGIKISAGEINFSSTKLNYYVTVSNSIASEIITLTKNQANQTIDVTDNNITVYATGATYSAPLIVGQNNFVITDTAQDKKTQNTYTVTITRLPPAVVVNPNPVSPTQYNPTPTKTSPPVVVTPPPPVVITETDPCKNAAPIKIKNLLGKENENGSISISADITGGAPGATKYSVTFSAPNVTTPILSYVSQVLNGQTSINSDISAMSVDSLFASGQKTLQISDTAESCGDSDTKVAEVVITPPPPANVASTPFSVACSINDITPDPATKQYKINQGDKITFSAYPQNGSGNYSYTWKSILPMDNPENTSVPKQIWTYSMSPKCGDANACLATADGTGNVAMEVLVKDNSTNSTAIGVCKVYITPKENFKRQKYPTCAETAQSSGSIAPQTSCSSCLSNQFCNRSSNPQEPCLTKLIDYPDAKCSGLPECEAYFKKPENGGLTFADNAQRCGNPDWGEDPNVLYNYKKTNFICKPDNGTSFPGHCVLSFGVSTGPYAGDVNTYEKIGYRKDNCYYGCENNECRGGVTAAPVMPTGQPAENNTNPVSPEQPATPPKKSVAPEAPLFSCIPAPVQGIPVGQPSFIQQVFNSINSFDQIVKNNIVNLFNPSAEKPITSECSAENPQGECPSGQVCSNDNPSATYQCTLPPSETETTPSTPAAPIITCAGVYDPKTDTAIFETNPKDEKASYNWLIYWDGTKNPGKNNVYKTFSSFGWDAGSATTNKLNGKKGTLDATLQVKNNSGSIKCSPVVVANPVVVTTPTAPTITCNGTYIANADTATFQVKGEDLESMSYRWKINWEGQKDSLLSENSTGWQDGQYGGWKAITKNLNKVKGKLDAIVEASNSSGEIIADAECLLDITASKPVAVTPSAESKVVCSSSNKTTVAFGDKIYFLIHFTNVLNYTAEVQGVHLSEKLGIDDIDANGMATVVVAPKTPGILTLKITPDEDSAGVPISGATPTICPPVTVENSPGASITCKPDKNPANVGDRVTFSVDTMTGFETNGSLPWNWNNLTNSNYTWNFSSPGYNWEKDLHSIKKSITVGDADAGKTITATVNVTQGNVSASAECSVVVNPSITCTATPNPAQVGQKVTFDVDPGNSFDKSSNNPISYHWDVYDYDSKTKRNLPTPPFTYNIKTPDSIIMGSQDIRGIVSVSQQGKPSAVCDVVVLANSVDNVKCNPKIPLIINGKKQSWSNSTNYFSADCDSKLNVKHTKKCVCNTTNKLKNGKYQYQYEIADTYLPYLCYSDETCHTFAIPYRFTYTYYVGDGNYCNINNQETAKPELAPDIGIPESDTSECAIDYNNNNSYSITIAKNKPKPPVVVSVPVAPPTETKVVPPTVSCNSILAGTVATEGKPFTFSGTASRGTYQNAEFKFSTPVKGQKPQQTGGPSYVSWTSTIIPTAENNGTLELTITPVDSSSRLIFGAKSVTCSVTVAPKPVVPTVTCSAYTGDTPPDTPTQNITVLVGTPFTVAATNVTPESGTTYKWTYTDTEGKVRETHPTQQSITLSNSSGDYHFNPNYDPKDPLSKSSTNSSLGENKYTVVAINNGVESKPSTCIVTVVPIPKPFTVSCSIPQTKGISPLPSTKDKSGNIINNYVMSIGESADFVANVAGGISPYKNYTWTATKTVKNKPVTIILKENGNSIFAGWAGELGTADIKVSVKDSSTPPNTAIGICHVNVTKKFQVLKCTEQPTQVELGKTATITFTVAGGTGQYQYFYMGYDYKTVNGKSIRSPKQTQHFMTCKKNSENPNSVDCITPIAKRTGDISVVCGVVSGAETQNCPTKLSWTVIAP